MMRINLDLPVSEYQYKILVAELGKSPKYLNRRSHFGRLLLSNFREDKKISKAKLGKNMMYYSVNIPCVWVEQYGLKFLSDESLKEFLETMEDIFMAKLFCYVDGIVDFKKQYNDKLAAKVDVKTQSKLETKAPDKLVAKMREAMLYYLQKFDITEENVKIETIIKAYQRYQMKMD